MTTGRPRPLRASDAPWDWETIDTPIAFAEFTPHDDLDAAIRHDHADPALIAGGRATFDWDEAAHPRDSHGRFGEGNGDKTFDDLMRDRPELFTKPTAEQDRSISRERRDLQLEAIAHARGFDGLPRHVTADEAKALVDAGHIPIYRGVDRPEYAMQFNSGDYRGGLGTYGNGSYFSTESGTANSYGGTSVLDPSTGTPISAIENGNVIAGFLPPDANIITSHDLSEMHIEAQMAISMSANTWVKDHPEATKDERDAFIAHTTGVLAALQDEGRFAAAHGYDAILTGGGSRNESYYVVLNRSALAVQPDWRG